MEIKTSYQGPIARVQLHRPQVRNSFHPLMIKELKQAFFELSKNPEIRVVILSGAGSVFCAGADLQWMKSMVKFSYEENRQDAGELYQLFKAISDCSVPVIGQVHGAAFGGALGLLVTCDLVIAESKTQFCFSEVKLGLAPAVISSFVAKKCSLSQVGPWMLGGAVMSASQALGLGLVNEIVEGEPALESVVRAHADVFLKAGPEAVKATKKLLRDISKLQSDDNSEQKIKELTVQVIAERRVSEEGQEGLSAFFEKRSPSWSPK